LRKSSACWRRIAEYLAVYPFRGLKKNEVGSRADTALIVYSIAIVMKTAMPVSVRGEKCIVSVVSE